jgi:hypothetical protein
VRNAALPPAPHPRQRASPLESVFLNLSGLRFDSISVFSPWFCHQTQPGIRKENLIMKDEITMRADNKGLTVKINFWPIHKDPAKFDSKMARLWIRGQATNADTRKVRKFNDAGELISILGKWNAEKFQKWKRSRKQESGN